MEDLIVGIKLSGSSFCAGVFMNNNIKIFENYDGQRVTPCFVLFTKNGEKVIGKQAEKLAIREPERGIFGFERLVGNDVTTRNRSIPIPFEVKSNNNNLEVVIQQTNKIINVTPKELYTICFQKLKKDAEDKLGVTINKSVFALPTYFNTKQREVVLAAAKDSGFTVLKVVNQPTAAALCYEYHAEDFSEISHHSVVFHLGGSSCEVGLIKTNSTKIEEIHFESDTSIGGKDFDYILMNYVCDELQSKHKNYDPRSNKRSLRTILKQCQEAKETLSVHEDTLINFEDNPSMEIKVTKEKLEELCHHLFQKAVDIVSNCLKASGIKKIRNIILIGGSTHMPKIRELLSSTFNCKVLKTIKPDECVVAGAAIIAAMMSEKEKQKIRKINLREIALSKTQDSQLDIPVANITIHEEAKLAKFALPARQASVDQYPLTSSNNFEKSELVVGIEINNSNLCIGLYSNGTAEVLKILEGSKTIPCRLFFSDTGEIFLGKCDKPLTVQPNHIIYDMERLIGRKFSDYDLQLELKSLPFSVQANKNGEPIVIIKRNNNIQKLSPKKLYTIIFEKLKKAIESKLQKTISKIVLAIALSFSETQKKVILSAARNAGFEILNLTNTPVAAGLYHYFEKNLGHSYSMVCNLQSTFEVAILEGTSTAIQKIGLTSEPKLGSKYFDNLLVKYVCDEVKKLYGCDPKTDKANLEKLNSVCANAKKALLYANETFVNLDGLFNVTYPIRLNLTKEKFEQACSHLFNRISEVVKSCTENTNIPSSVIEEVILVGDLHFPKIKKIISDYLRGVQYRNGDDYVIKGIAVLGALLSKHPEQKVRNIHLVEDGVLSLQTSLPHTVEDFESDSDQETENFNTNNEDLSNIAVGIDLGTTNSCVCVYMDGRTKVLENLDAGRVTPSFVFFSPQKETIVGIHAKRRANRHPSRGIYEIKRLLGRQFNDPHLQAKLKFLPFSVQAASNADPIIFIDDRSRPIKKTPEEMCTIILQKLKEDVETQFCTKIKKAVVTVPAYFNVKQREATLKAAKDAGLTVLKLLNEPTAAALCYFSETECYGSTYSMIYDLGGGTFDVAILKRTRENIEIVCVDGDTELGGQDFDNLIMEYICNEVKWKYFKDLRKDKLNLRRIHNKCEEAKITLSTVTETTVTLTGFLNEHPLIDVTVTRKKLEEMCMPFFEKTLAIVTNCIKSSGISKSSIDKVILCGGSTRIPKIQEMLSNYFDGKTLSKYIHPDECVAEGAAVQAAMLSKHPRQKIKQIRLSDVLPLSLGSATLGNKMNFLIKRNSPIPTQATMTYATMHDQETFINIEIYEGERADVRKNRFLGKMQISNITPAPPAHCQVNLTLSVDENGIITATAKEKFQENVKELKLDYSRGARNEHEVKNAVLDAENYKEEDERFVRFVDQKIYLMRYCTSIAFNLNEKDLADKYETTYDLCEEFYTLAQDMEVDQEEELLNMLQEIKILCEPLVKEYDFKLTV